MKPSRDQLAEWRQSPGSPGCVARQLALLDLIDSQAAEIERWRAADSKPVCDAHEYPTTIKRCRVCETEDYAAREALSEAVKKGAAEISRLRGALGFIQAITEENDVHRIARDALAELDKAKP